MKRKIIIISSVVLAIIVMAIVAIPVFSADGTGTTQPANQSVQVFDKKRILIRLLYIQNEAKVDTLIARAQNADKITEEQAIKIKEFWTNHHKKFARKVILTRLMRAEDGVRVQAFLDKAVSAEKITKEQAEKLKKLWTYLHSN